MSKETYALDILVLAFENMAEDSIEKVEAMLRRYRQAKTLADTFERIRRLGELPQGATHGFLENYLRRYNEVSMDDLSTTIEEVRENI